MLRHQNREIRWFIVVLTTLVVVACMGIALRRIRVESDLTTSIPAGSPVLDSGRRLLAKHPLIDWVAIDIASRDGTTDSARLVGAARIVEAELSNSREFASVGSADWVQGLAALHDSLVTRLPGLFSREELENLVLPRLADESIRSRLEQSYQALGELEGVGQARDMAADPLGLRELVYARLSALFPKSNAHVDQNHLVSADGKHLLLTAVPHHALGDPEKSRRIAAALDAAQRRLDETAALDQKGAFVLTPAGAYRAAMDNEAIVKRDTNRAVWLVTIAVSLLLLACFSRPVLGLLTLLPATAGVAVALLLYSFFSRSMSALSLGFGAALISITVDQGIVYIAYLDRVRGATGKKAAKQTFSAVSLATLTTVGAFFALKFSGYRLLEELGIFAALGSAFSFVFVHSVFPLIFRAARPTEQRPFLPVDRWLRWLSTGRVWPRVTLGLLVALGLGIFARPHFEVDLNRLNTVTAETRAAEELVRGVWGDLMSRAYVLIEARDVKELQRQSDRLALLLSRERELGAASSTFSPSLLWPGKQLTEQHLADWRGFWTEPRRSSARKSLTTAAAGVGFASDAFDPFLQSIDAPQLSDSPIPEAAYSLLGVARARDDDGWVWLGGFERGPNYDAVRFAADAQAASVSVFDGAYFGRSLNQFLATAFQRMLLIVAPFVLVAVGLSFWNLRLILLVLFPVVLALVATLGTFGVLGLPIDIPGLMIAVVVLGMGTNFSVYLVNAHQRYPDPTHAVHDSVRLAALLDGGATVLGMSVMAASVHVAARSAGLSGLLGIGFSLFGALVLLPPILLRVAPIGGPWLAGEDLSARQRFLARFRFLEPRVVWSAWRSVRSSRRLEAIGQALGEVRHLLVVGCGYGIEAAWILANQPECRVTAIEFDEDRCHVTRSVLGNRGQVIGNDWSAAIELDPSVDAVLLLEPAGLAATNELAARVRELAERLAPNTRIVIEAGPRRIDDLEQLLNAIGLLPRRNAAANLVVCESRAVVSSHPAMS
jgi:uncharacterized protein